MAASRIARSGPRLTYPNSYTYWQDHRPMLVDAGVQTAISTDIASNPSLSDPVRHPTPPPPYSEDLPTPVVPQTSPIYLSDEQKRVLNLVRSGRNVFFTGPAGTGKSFLLREIIRDLRVRLPADSIAVTATTGVAGANIGGSTVHSFAGIGLGNGKVEDLADRIAGSTILSKRWRSVRVLVVDEISMMDGVLFDKLEYIARSVRHCQRPFGGIQLVLSGDFFQLPPVSEKAHLYRRPSSYAFQAKTWLACIYQPIFLTQVFRQHDDAFISILSSMRIGQLSPTQVELLQGLSRPVRYGDGIEPSELFPLRCEVETCNNARLTALPGPEFLYESMDKSGHDNQGKPIPYDAAVRLLERLIAPSRIVLKRNAQVMLISNVIQGVLVNGSVGIVIEFLDVHDALKRDIKIAELQNGPEKEELRRKQWLHKELLPINNHCFTGRQKWPLVRFTDGNELLCAPLEFSVEGFMGNREASRMQVPLILAWALSVHKSQGLTLPRVKVNLGRVFEKGQAYVAISRATTLEHLEITNFQPAKVRADDAVIQWQEHWLRISDVDREALFNEEMESEEAISRYWTDISVSLENRSAEGMGSR